MGEKYSGEKALEEKWLREWLIVVGVIESDGAFDVQNPELTRISF